MADEVEIPVKVVDRRRWREDGAPNPDAAEPVSLKPTYVEALEQRTELAEKQAQEYIGKYRAAAQEFEDARARMRKEVAKDAERSRREVFIGLLDIVDNLDRAIDAASTERRTDPLLQGVVMVRDQFLAKLEGFGITRIDTDQMSFDPVMHEAVSTVPATDRSKDGQIAGTIRHGYRIGTDVLRPALVAVTKSSV